MKLVWVMPQLVVATKLELVTRMVGVTKPALEMQLVVVMQLVTPLWLQPQRRQCPG